MNPKTLATDLVGSPLGQDISPEDAETMENLVNGLTELVNAYAQLDPKQMQEDLDPILGKFRDGATYEKGGKEGDFQLYTMHVPGENVRVLVADVCRYLYVDSSIGKAMSSLYAAAPAEALPEELAGKSYEEAIEQELIGEILNEMGDLPLDVVLKVGSGNLIRGLDVEAVVTEELKAQGIETLRFSYLEAEENVGSGAMTLKGTDEDGQPLEMNMQIGVKLLDGVYDVTLDMDADGTDSATGTPLKMKMTETVYLDKDGAFKVNFDVSMPEFALSEGGVGYTVTCEGTVKQEGDTITYDFPNLGIDVDVMGEKVALSFAAKSVSNPVESPYQAARASKNLLTMSEQELEAELQKYSDGINGLAGQLFGFLMGGAPATAFPPAA